ncbi:MAG: hypothetical protein PF517_10195 [Salinivirgaceae bacterium]|jgi:hypothetical protein|nr:hypothetical protein [Salinivirgaceae bacterium]
MTHNNSNIINEFLDNFPREKIVATLSSIDDKIGSLHTISSKDFLYFNKLLKQYYSNIKEISSANNAIAVFFNTDLPTIHQEIKEKNASQIQLLNDTDSNILKIQHYLTCIYSSFDLLVVPVNNFKQNLTTLKYILANLKLHLNYIDLKNAEELQKSISKIENGVEDIHNQLNNINLQSDSVLEQIIDLKNNSCLNENLNNTELKEELKKILNNYKRMSFGEYLPENLSNSLNNHTQKSFAYLGEVITNIQYHDIIRQKMEHIQSSQNELIKEINDIDLNKPSQDDQLNIIVKIPEITDIQVAQLLYTNKDYQTSIEKITNQLIEVGHEMKSMDKLYNSIHKNSQSFEDTFVNQIVVAQDVFEKHYQLLGTNWEESDTKIKNLDTDYNTLKINFNKLFQSEKTLRAEVRQFEKLIDANDKSFGIELMRRLSHLFSDIQINSNSLKTHLNNITQNLDFLLNIIKCFKPDIQNHYIENSSIEDLTEKSQEIKQKTKEYAKLSTHISDEITQSIKKIEYYTYFKETVEGIVSLLNTINQIVNYDSLKHILGDNKEYLNRIKDLYTMKSERDVHARLFDVGQNSEDKSSKDNESSYDMDDGDIELF